jgi:FMN phosphatase YigB (HAD superfamily)
VIHCVAVRVASFDVLDTLLTRVHAAPDDLFLELGEAARAAGLSGLTPGQFVGARAEAERRARGHTSHGEPTLEEIHRFLAGMFGWSGEARERLMQLELEVEERSIKAVPGMAVRVEAARRDPDQILFLSDTYLPSDFLRGVLRREGFFRDGDKLFVSAELEMSKASGRFYAEVRHRLDARFAEWTHLGDNPWSDVAVPERMGIKSQVFSGTRLNRYEKLARGGEGEVTLRRSKLAGAMRLARLENAETDPLRRVIWDTGCDVAGPVLAAKSCECTVASAQLTLGNLFAGAGSGELANHAETNREILLALPAAVLRFAARWNEVARHGEAPVEDLREVSRALNQCFYSAPTCDEALAWGRLSFLDSQGHPQPTVPDWNWFQTVGAVLNPSRRPPCWWIEGALARRSCLPLKLLLAARQFKQRFTRAEPARQLTHPA